MKRKERVNSFLKTNPNLEEYSKISKLDLFSSIDKERKVYNSIEDVIKKAGLKDGMTISFHHHFRNGDYIVNMVLDVIAKMGIKNLTLASSSLAMCHEPIIDHIKNNVITKIYTSGLRGKLAEEISRGLLKEPINIHSHGGRVHLIMTGELNIDIAFLGIPKSDTYGNGTGEGVCGSMGYALIDAKHADKVVLLTEEFVEYPCNPASIAQDQVDYIVKVNQVGDPDKIGGGATRITSNPRELLIAQKTADVIFNSGYFKDGFSFQTGTGGASLAVTRFLEDRMKADNIRAGFALGGITSTMVKLFEAGLIKKLYDVQSFDKGAAESIERNENHIEISANQYANYSSKGASVERLDIVVLSALEIDTEFNVNVLTGSDGVLRGASGGHSDTAASAQLAIIVAPLVRGRIPTVIDNVLTCITPGENIDVLVTDHGVAVNPQRPDIIEKLKNSGISLFTIEQLRDKAYELTGKPATIKTKDNPIAIIRYRDGKIIDTVYQVED